jgi:phosphoribosylamine--glycine ligase
MNVLLLGSGGREHALAWKMAQSELLSKLFVAPGNAGTAEVAQNVDLAVNDFTGIGKFAIDEQIDMLVVGPEDPLVNGITDYFATEKALQHIAVIGPDKAGAELEGSKAFAKAFMEEFAIPTARYASFTADTFEEGKAFLTTLAPPYVLKADGLAAGKGVLIIDELESAVKALDNMLHDGKFGAAGNTVVIEEFLDGIELSVFVLTDGKNYKILPTAKDYKRIGEGDTGLNTGGMGAISPVPFADDSFMSKVEERIVIPTIEGLGKRGMRYRGFVFIGLMKVGGDPYVVEYNVRMGDPETEVVIPRIKSDLLPVFKAMSEENLEGVSLEVDSRAATTVMLVSGGYPEAYEKGKTIVGLDQVNQSLVFHAGTKKEGEALLTSGGRVLAVTSFGENKEEALRQSYENASRIKFDGCYYRKDIGFDL